MKCYSIRIPYDRKSPPGRIALRQKGKMLPERPATGEESCFAGFLFIVHYKEVYNEQFFLR